MYTFIIICVCVLLLELFTIKTTRCIQMPSFPKQLTNYIPPSVLICSKRKKSCLIVFDKNRFSV